MRNSVIKEICNRDEERVKEIWRTADAVIFDVDSTLIKELSTYELAKFCNKKKTILDLTQKASKYVIPYETALERIINIIQPTKDQINTFNESKCLTLSPKVKDLIRLLQKKNVPVYLVTGGFMSVVEPIANELLIPLENIFANKLKFYYNGAFAGYSKDEYMTSLRGKFKVADELKRRFGYKKLVIIGDGLTDMQTCPPIDAFIGYGGNVVREEIRQRTPWYVTDFRELILELRRP